MIRKIEFTNFYSFKGKQTLDFTTTKKKSNDYFTSYDGKQISKVVGILGSNGSGKTNVMRLFGFLAYFLKSSERKNPEEYNTWFKSYAFSKSKNSKFNIEFETQDKLFCYELVATSTEIIEENLSFKELRKRSKITQIFYRTKKNILLNKKLIKGVTPKQLLSVRKDVSLIPFIKANYEEIIINEVHGYFENYITNVTEIGSPFSPSKNMIKMAALLYKHSPSLKKKMEDVFKNFDIGIDSFDIDIKDVDSDVKINTHHKIYKKDYSLPFQYESHGTRSLFLLLVLILGLFNRGNVLIIDEIEVGLHSEAVTKIIQYIIDNLEDGKKQFIFTSHSLDFLKKFDIQQVFLVEKKDSASEVFRLDKLGIRSDENLFSKYMSGSYGAFPKIRI